MTTPLVPEEKKKKAQVSSWPDIPCICGKRLNINKPVFESFTCAIACLVLTPVSLKSQRRPPLSPIFTCWNPIETSTTPFANKGVAIKITCHWCTFILQFKLGGNIGTLVLVWSTAVHVLFLNYVYVLPSCGKTITGLNRQNQQPPKSNKTVHTFFSESSWDTFLSPSTNQPCFLCLTCHWGSFFSLALAKTTENTLQSFIFYPKN